MRTELHQIVYVSAARHEMSDDELEAILATSRRNNGPRGITGMLLYSDGSFIQAVEGPKDEVFDLYRTIEKDPRHGTVIKLLNGPIEERNFPEWQMGFKRVDPSALPKNGFSSFLEEPAPGAAAQDELERPLKLLLSFKASHA